jgi:hypothetical protein
MKNNVIGGGLQLSGKSGEAALPGRVTTAQDTKYTL